ncbi:MAG: epoxyqueuosine reductase [Eubacteriales bacterium]|jgi:epoxyqueuosine reductase
MHSQSIAALFLQEGLDQWGCASLEGFPLRPTKGAAQLTFTPTRALCALFPYFSPHAAQIKGNLSLYARSTDYHITVQKRLVRIAEKLQELFPSHHFACFTDNSPLDEVYTAIRCGLGKRGMNGLLLNPGYGSWCFIGAILCDVDELPISSPCPQPVCTHCGACVAACPSRALAMEECGAHLFHLDRCLSHLSQSKGDLSPQQLQWLADSPLIWGCDQCQLVCPVNRQAKPTPLPEFQSPLHASLSLEELEGLSNREFALRFGQCAFAWRGKAPLLRNLRLHPQSEEG